MGIAEKVATAVMARAIRRFRYAKYAGRTDIEFAVLAFVAFLLPIGTFFVWGAPLGRSVLACVLFPTVGLILAQFYAEIIAVGKKYVKEGALVFEDGAEARRNSEAASIVTALIIGLSYAGATAILCLTIGVPITARYPVAIITIATSAVFALSPILYYLIQEEWERIKRREAESLKEWIQSTRATFSGLLVLLGVAAIAPALSAGSVRDLFGLRSNPTAEIWAFVWWAIALFLLGVSIMGLGIIRIVDMHMRYVQQLQSLQEHSDSGSSGNAPDSSASPRQK